MPPEASLSAGRVLAGLPAIPAHWRAALLRLALASLALVALTWDDWAAMAYQWWHISTYSHVLLVPVVLGWLVWQRRDALAALEPQGWWPGLLLLAGALLLWLLGTLAPVNLARQLGAVVMLQATMLTLLGPRVAAALVFPLAYMLFLVPFGDELVPALQMITADITIALTIWSGIPAQIEGVFIDTPVGLFEVAEACSGVKFLVAMLALGTLAAHVCFRGWVKRSLFMVVALAVPILANGVRAWGTIYIAQSQGIEFAAGFDHIFYGWFFFALVMVLVLGLAWRFFDRDPLAPFVAVERIRSSALLDLLARFRLAAWVALAAIVLLAAAFAAWASVASRAEAALPARIDLPDVPGWSRAFYNPRVWWEPRAGGADHRLLARYQDAQGRQVDVFYALYAAQDDARKAAGFGEGALVPDTDWRWLEPGPAIASATTDRLLAQGRHARTAATFYRTGEVLTGSNARLRLANMVDRLLMRENPTMLLILSVEEAPGVDAQANIAAFRAATGDTGAWMDRIAKGG